MATQHGKRSSYNKGCRCEDCVSAERSYQDNRRQTKLMAASVGNGPVVAFRQVATATPASDGPGRVEAGVLSEVEGLEQALERPGLRETALALARIMDNPKAVNQQAAAAAKLTDLLDKLRKGADSRRSKLASVRAMTSVKTG
jgi:hypothetical protein